MPGEKAEEELEERTVVQEPRTSAMPDFSGEATLPQAAPGEVLTEGTTLGGRFRIVRLIANGGMGAVYEAEDTALGIRVALKTLLASIAADPAMLERFRREVLLARQVTHRNVCRLFELYLTPDGPGPTAFLTMELLEGPTLADALAETGPLSEAQALPLVRQMVAALGAAHAAGVTHRDFKPGNVMLVGDGPRVVVTDFGIARGATTGQQTLTAVDGMVGTPAYMAPEQVTGRAVTYATDVYALGAVVFEMLAGRPPFRADTPLATALQRVDSDAPALRTVRPDVSGPWNDTVRACLQREPDQRPSLDAVLPALEGRAPRFRVNRWAVGLAAALLLASVWAARRWLSHPVHPSGSTLAVLGFKNISGDRGLDWLSTALSEMLTTELNQGNLHTVPGEQVARARQELGIASAETLSPETLGRLRDAYGTDAVLVGTYFDDGRGTLRIDARLQDARDGHLLQSLSETGSRERLVSAVEHLGQGLRTAVHASRAPEGTPLLAATLPRSPEAAKLYVEALDRSRAYDEVGARALLQRSVALEADFAPAHALLGTVSAALGFEEEAASEAKLALQYAGGLPKRERLMLEAENLVTAGKAPAAVAKLHELLAQSPLDSEALLLLARHGNVSEAQAAIARLRALGAPASEDPRIDLAEGRAKLRGGDVSGALRQAEQARTRAQTLGLTSLSAEALRLAGDAAESTPDWPGAVRFYEQAEAEYVRTGNLLAAVGVRTDRAWLLLDLNRPAEARTLAVRVSETLLSVRAFRRLGELADLFCMLAIESGEQAEAHRALARGRESLARAFTSPDALALTEAELAYSEGDLPLAKGALQRAEHWYETTRGETPAYVHTLRAHIAFERDEPAEAKRLLDNVLAHAGENADVWGPAVYLKYTMLMDQREPAAVLALVEERRLMERTRGLPYPRAFAASPLAEAQLALHRVAEARKTLASVADLDAPLAQLEFWCLLESARAHLSQAEGQKEAALRRMEALLRLVPAWRRLLHGDVELTWGRLLLDAGQRSRGQKVLRALASDARAHGLLRLARNANEALAAG